MSWSATASNSGNNN